MGCNRFVARRLVRLWNRRGQARCEAPAGERSPSWRRWLRSRRRPLPLTRFSSHLVLTDAPSWTTLASCLRRCSDRRRVPGKRRERSRRSVAHGPCSRCQREPWRLARWSMPTTILVLATPIPFPSVANGVPGRRAAGLCGSTVFWDAPHGTATRWNVWLDGLIIVLSLTFTEWALYLRTMLLAAIQSTDPTAYLPSSTCSPTF